MYRLQKNTEADPDKWEAFSRYNHYYEGGLFEETFSIPEGSPRQRFRVDVYLAINNSIVDSFTPGPPSAFYSADCPDCPKGLYGDNCSASCNCVGNTTCDSSNGACRYGCNYGFTGLSCDIALPTLSLPPVVYNGEECGTTVVTWIPGNYTDLDSRINVHSYQIDSQEVNKGEWSRNDELIQHSDFLRLFVANISGLRTGEYRFRINIRVSEYDELLAEFTLGPASNAVNIQCRSQYTIVYLKRIRQ
ncbi:uncharacterized protein LOC125682029 [Ostrea edulis]|uniref:uncharacterized protein LOC125682029 n=1 Tax=Ostrea edulis TaxID=37623 RepID=UPI0024AFEAC1|nr:uncharacterized protein LOC125682029 [Ostrea edulis]